MNSFPDHRSLYRLPWSFSDNPIAWLEPTSACNIYCEGCYRANVKDAHKSLKEAMDLWCAGWFWPAYQVDSAPLPSDFSKPDEKTIEVSMVPD